MKLEGFIEFIKFINAYTHTEGKNQEEFMKGIWKFQVNETDFGIVFLVENMYASDFWCMKFYCHN